MRREIKHNGNRRREREGARKGGNEENEGRKETERERYGEQGRLIEQLRDEERAAGSGERKRYGLANKRQHSAAANCSPYDASLGLRAADSACYRDLWPRR